MANTKLKIIYSNTLAEDIETHDTLNPKLFDENNKLKDEVRDKIEEIVTIFTDELAEDEVKIAIDDIILIGSNVSYNYTKDSDLDVHIIADTSETDCPDNLYPKLYSAYRSLFNRKFDINFYGIPVELYVETADSARVSNGEYSVRNNKWIKEPKKEAIPEIDKKALDKEFSAWEKRYKDIKNNPTVEKVDEYLEDIYNIRRHGIQTTGEYGTENLLFKECRNKGYLDDLKELRCELLSKQLSLESKQLNEPTAALDEAFETFTPEQLFNCRQKIMQTVHLQPIADCYGNFAIYGIREQDVDNVLKKLKQLDIIADAHKFASGRYDFSHINFMTRQPSKFFTIQGKLRY